MFRLGKDLEVLGIKQYERGVRLLADIGPPLGDRRRAGEQITEAPTVSQRR